MATEHLSKLVQQVNRYQLNKKLLKSFDMVGIAPSDGELKTDTCLILRIGYTKIRFIDLPNLNIPAVAQLREDIMIHDVDKLNYMQHFTDSDTQKILSKACLFNFDILRACEMKLERINEIVKLSHTNETLSIDQMGSNFMDIKGWMDKIEVIESGLQTMLRHEKVIKSSAMIKCDSKLDIRIQEFKVFKNVTDIRKKQDSRSLTNKIELTNWKESMKFDKKKRNLELKEFNERKRSILKKQLQEGKVRMLHRQKQLRFKNINRLNLLKNLNDQQEQNQLVLENLRKSVYVEAENNRKRTIGTTISWENKQKIDLNPVPKLSLVLHTFTNDELFKNDQFCLLFQLHAKGLTKTKYAGNIIRQISK